MAESQIFPILAIFLGGFITIAGVVSGLKSERLMKRGRLADGVVTKMVRSQGGTSDNLPCYSPEFQYSDGEGVLHIVQSNEGQSSPTLFVGQKVKVLYDPSQPSIAQIDTFGQMWLVPIMFSFVGAIFLVMGLVMLWKQSTV